MAAAKLLAGSLALCALIHGCSYQTAKQDGPFLLAGGDSTFVCRLGIDRVDTVGVVPLPGALRPTDTPSLSRIGIKPALDRDRSIRRVGKAVEQISVGNEGWIAFPSRDSAVVSVWRADNSGHVEKSPPLALPRRFTLWTTLIDRGMLYLGGGRDDGRTLRVGAAAWQSGERLGLCALAAESLSWDSVPLPERARGLCKHVDGLLLFDDRLVAVDKFLDESKLFIEYDVRDRAQPVPSEIVRVGPHWAGGEVLSVAEGGLCFAQLLESVEVDRVGQLLSLYDYSTLECIAYSENDVRIGSDTSGLFNDTSLVWHSIAFAGDVLLVAAGNRGIGLADLGRAEIREHLGNVMENLRETHGSDTDPGDLLSVRHPVPAEGRDKASRLLEEQLAYVQPKSLPKGEVLALWDVPQLRSVSVLLWDDTAFTSGLVPWEELGIEG